VFKVTLADESILAIRVQSPCQPEEKRVQEMQSSDFEVSHLATLVRLRQKGASVPLIHGYWKTEHGFVSVQEYIDGLTLEEFFKGPDAKPRNNMLEQVAELLRPLYQGPAGVEGIGSLYFKDPEMEFVVSSTAKLSKRLGLRVTETAEVRLGPLTSSPRLGPLVKQKPRNIASYRTASQWLTAIAQGNQAYSYANDLPTPSQYAYFWVTANMLSWIISVWHFTLENGETTNIFFPKDLGLHNIIIETETNRLVLIDMDNTTLEPSWRKNRRYFVFRSSDENGFQGGLEEVMVKLGILVQRESDEVKHNLYSLAVKSEQHALELKDLLSFVARWTLAKPFWEYLVASG